MPSRDAWKSYPRCEKLCAPLWGTTAPGGSGTRTSRLSLRERSEGVWEFVLMGLSLTVLLSSASSNAMACETPDGRVPPGDGFPGGADILVTKEVSGDTADNLYLEVKQPQSASNRTHCFA